MRRLVAALAFVSAEETREEGWPYYPVLPAYDTGRAPFYECSGQDRLAVSSAVEAYSAGRKMPPGCDCRKTGESDEDCTLFECTCICDLTAGMCDPNCCCDAECSQEQASRFEAVEGCQAEGPVAEEITKCYSTKVVDKVNPRFPTTAKGTAKSSLDRMLCVRYDNSDLRGEYYDDPGSPSPSIFDDDKGQKDFDYPNWLSTNLRTYAVDQTYDVGDAVVAAFESVVDGSFVYAHGGVLPLPVADHAGECLETERAKFGSSASGRCARRFDNVSATCASGLLSSARFASSLYVGRHPGATPAGDAWVKVEVRRVRWRDPRTGLETDFSDFDPLSCDTFYDDAEDASSPDTTVTSSSSCAASFDRPAAPACRDALADLCYTIVYSGKAADSRILKAYADLVLTDVPATSLTLTQRFAVVFQSESPVARSNANANVVNRTRSGNPGYLLGRPLLAGAKSDDGTRVVPQIDGLRVLGATGDSSCLESDPDAVVVPFGSDLRTGCLLRLDRAELEDFCRGDGPHAAAKGLPRYFNVSADLVFQGETHSLADDLVGIFGNADPLDPTQWLDITVKPAAAGQDAAQWRELEGVCLFAITSMNYRFLWAFVGARDNPQPKIIAARLEFGTEDLVYRYDGTNPGVQAFSIQTTVTFKEYKADYDHYTPPSPPVAISVPYDVWYPFKIESAARQVASPHLRLLLFLVTPLLVALFWPR